MHNYRKWGVWMGAGAVLLTLGAGCDNNQATEPVAATDPRADAEVGEVVDNVGETGKAVENAGEAVAEGAAEAGKEVAQGAEAVGKEVAQGADKAAEVVGDAAQVVTTTPDVKAAILANDSFTALANDIDVDTNADARTVVLRGSVNTNDQKSLAESIAKKEAPNYKITNQLAVK